MIAMGAQIRAGRALLSWTRRDLALAARLHRNAIAYWERRTRIPVGQFREPHACRRMREAFEHAGVIVFIEPAPGVRLGSGHNFLTTTHTRRGMPAQSDG